MDLLRSENVTMEFLEACQRGDIDKVANLFKRKEEIDVRQLDKKETAVMNGDSEIVELLSTIVVNVDQEDNLFGLRPLQHACGGGNLHCKNFVREWGRHQCH